MMTARLGLACLMLLSACKLATTPADRPDEQPKDCEGDACASNAPPIDWASDNPTYTAHLLVVDTAGEPVKDATVKIGDKSAVTDKNGRVEVGPLDAVEVATVGVEKEGATPQITKATAFSSGHTTQEVQIAPLDVDKMVDVQKQTTADVEGAHIDVPARALANADGSRATMARMQLTYFDGAEPQAAVPGDGEGLNAEGAPTLMGPLGGVLYVRFENTAKKPLNLAPGQSAMLELPIGSAVTARDGEELPMWTLDEATNKWKKESSCVVSSRSVGGKTQQVCTGPVSHFSYWSYAREYDIYKPGSVGCMNVTFKAEQDACFSVAMLSRRNYKCDAKGEKCQPFYGTIEQFIQYKPDIAQCSVAPADGSTYRTSVVYKTDVSGCVGADAPLGGTRSKMSEPLDLASFKEMLGSEVMLNFTLNGERDCPTLCVQVPMVVTRQDLDVKPWTDRDQDGYYTETDENLKSPFYDAKDCNDDDYSIHPYTRDLFCIDADRNCDGVNQYKAYEKYSDVDSYRWNTECALCDAASLPLVDEVRGNAHDENCDGFVADYDNDGFDWPADCNDYYAGVAPNKKEVAGNYVDEDCDGAYLDWDGDGLFNPYHVHLAEKLGLALDKFVDCDDYDPRVNPNVPHSAEAALASYFYDSGAGVRRSYYYCGLFDQKGEPNANYHRVVRDLNCDTWITDRDGDGYAALGNRTLGEGRATDCNDNDPRIHPVSETDPTCEIPAGLLDDSVCNVPTRIAEDGACPVITVAGADVVTRCEEGKDAMGNPTGIGVCSYDGWWDGNPLIINPGTAWGPCDGDAETNPLPACPPGTTCGGELPYTAAFTQYIEDTYLMSMPINFKGTCFPSCDLKK